MQEDQLLNNISNELTESEKVIFTDSILDGAYDRLLEFSCVTDRGYEIVPHLEVLANKLEGVERGEIKKLMVFAPPRHGKTELTSKKFPAWYLGKNPDKRIIISSYAASLASSNARVVRNTVESDIYNAIMGVTTSQDSRAVDEWNIASPHKGGMIAAGVGGSITGYGADVLIIDDPVKNREEAESKVYREKAWEWYRTVARTRLEPGAAIILIMTRWHAQDLAGKILEEDGDNWDVVHLPAIADSKVTPSGDLMGREDGQALWPQRYSEEELKITKDDVGSRAWFALYQGTPKDPESQIIQREWIQYYNEIPPNVKRGGGIDTATSKKTSADNMAFVDVCRDDAGNLYADEVFCEKISVTPFAQHVNNSHRTKKYWKIKIESNNAGEAVKQRIDEISKAEGNGVPIKAEVTSTDKVVRVYEFQHLIENGTLKFKKGHKKVAALIEHLINFDGNGSDIDDDVDALGFGIKAANERPRTIRVS